MIVRRSRDAFSGVRFVQKYCSALRPTTGIPFAANTFAISRSIGAHPPSPDTNTTSVSELPPVLGTSIRGSFGVLADAVAAATRSSSGRIVFFMRTGGREQHAIARYSSVQELNPACNRLRSRRRRRSGIDHVRQKQIGVG